MAKKMQGKTNMIWMDYNITQAGNNFKVLGEWEGEVMGKNQDGSDKGYALYRSGDVFVVNETGWFVKQNSDTSPSSPEEQKIHDLKS